MLKIYGCAGYKNGGGASLVLPSHFHVKISAERLLWWDGSVPFQSAKITIRSRSRAPPSKAPNRVFRLPKWQPAVGKWDRRSTQHARVSGRNMIYDAQKKRNKTPQTFCEWQMYARSVTRDDAVGCAHLHSPLFVLRLELRVSLNFLWERNYSARTLWCCTSGLCTANKLWHVTCLENLAATVWVKFTIGLNTTEFSRNYYHSKFNLKSLEKLELFIAATSVVS